MQFFSCIFDGWLPKMILKIWSRYIHSINRIFSMTLRIYTKMNPFFEIYFAYSLMFGLIIHFDHKTKYVLFWHLSFLINNKHQTYYVIFFSSMDVKTKEFHCSSILCILWNFCWCIRFCICFRNKLSAEKALLKIQWE